MASLSIIQSVIKFNLINVFTVVEDLSIKLISRQKGKDEKQTGALAQPLSRFLGKQNIVLKFVKLTFWHTRFTYFKSVLS